MNHSPSQILEEMRVRGSFIQEGRHRGDFPGQGRRHSVYYRHPNGGKEMIINQLTVTEDTRYDSPRSYFGYLKMNKFRIEDLTPEEIRNINKSKTMPIHGITFERLIELLDILYQSPSQ